MTWDDIIYVSLLIVSIPLGHLIKLQSSYYVKKYLSTGIGFLIATIVCGRHIVHSLVTVLVNTILLAILPKRCVVLIFLISSLPILILFLEKY